MPIREMREEDLPQVLALQCRLAFQDWNEKQFIAEIRASYALCVVYEQNNFIDGYAIFHLMGPDSELLSIATSPEHQRAGIGTVLLNEGLSKLDFAGGDRMFLEVRKGNAKARRFYEKNGFREYSTRKNYYNDGEDAVLYSRA